jgi:hypothetical protein
MSDAVLVLIGTASGAIIGALATMIPSWLERKDKWRFATFEKRLEAHQKAYALCQQVNELVHRGDDLEFEPLAKRCDDWWSENCFYLDKDSRTRFRDLIGAMWFSSKSLNEIRRCVDKTCRALEKGIGHKHLESVKDSDNFSDKVLRGFRSSKLQ